MSTKDPQITDVGGLLDRGPIERVIRKFKQGEEPSMVAEYAHFSNSERAEMFLRLRQRVIKERYGADPGFTRVCRIVRRT